jgi:hypothetical protein
MLSMPNKDEWIAFFLRRSLTFLFYLCGQTSARTSSTRPVTKRQQRQPIQQQSYQTVAVDEQGLVGAAVGLEAGRGEASDEFWSDEREQGYLEQAGLDLILQDLNAVREVAYRGQTNRLRALLESLKRSFESTDWYLSSGFLPTNNGDALL